MELHVSEITLKKNYKVTSGYPYQSCLSKYKQIDITSYILFDHNAIKLELNNKNWSRKYATNWKLSNIFLNDQGVICEKREEIKRFLEVNEN
jgi:hypothetical protein